MPEDETVPAFKSVKSLAATFESGSTSINLAALSGTSHQGVDQDVSNQTRGSTGPAAPVEQPQAPISQKHRVPPPRPPIRAPSLPNSGSNDASNLARNDSKRLSRPPPIPSRDARDRMRRPTSPDTSPHATNFSSTSRIPVSPKSPTVSPTVPTQSASLSNRLKVVEEKNRLSDPFKSPPLPLSPEEPTPAGVAVHSPNMLSPERAMTQKRTRISSSTSSEGGDRLTLPISPGLSLHMPRSRTPEPPTSPRAISGQRQNIFSPNSDNPSPVGQSHSPDPGAEHKKSSSPVPNHIKTPPIPPRPKSIGDVSALLAAPSPVSASGSSPRLPTLPVSSTVRPTPNPATPNQQQSAHDGKANAPTSMFTSAPQSYALTKSQSEPNDLFSSSQAMQTLATGSDLSNMMKSSSVPTQLKQLGIPQELSVNGLAPFAPEMSFSSTTPPVLEHVPSPIYYTKSAVRWFLAYGNYIITGHREYTQLIWLPNARIISTLHHPELKATSACWVPSHSLTMESRLIWMGFNNGDIWSVDMFGLTPSEQRMPEPAGLWHTKQDIPSGSMPSLAPPYVIERSRPSHHEICWLKRFRLKVLYMDTTGCLGCYNYNHQNILSLEKSQPVQIFVSGVVGGSAKSHDDEGEQVVAEVVSETLWLCTQKGRAMIIISLLSGAFGDRRGTLEVPSKLGGITCISYGNKCAVNACIPPSGLASADVDSPVTVNGNVATGHECGRIAIWDPDTLAVLLVVPISVYPLSAVWVSSKPFISINSESQQKGATNQSTSRAARRTSLSSGSMRRPPPRPPQSGTSPGSTAVRTMPPPLHQSSGQKVATAIDPDAKIERRFLVWVALQTGSVHVFDTTRIPWICVKNFKPHDLETGKVIKFQPSIMLHEDAVHQTFREKYVSNRHRSVSQDTPLSPYELGSCFSPFRIATLAVGQSGNKENAGCVALWDSSLMTIWEDMHIRLHEALYSRYSNIGMQVCSWNIDSSKPADVESASPGFLQSWVQPTKLPVPAEILVVGLQEVVDLESKRVTAKSIFKGHKQKHAKAEFRSGDIKRYKYWQAAMEKHLSGLQGGNGQTYTYRLFASRSLVGLFMMCFVRNDVYPLLQNPDMCEVKTGFGGYHGNKGAISSRFTFLDSSFCLTMAHLSAGQKEVVERNRDVGNIFESATFPPLIGTPGSFINGGDGRAILDHEVSMFFGDLNYRINLPRDKILQAIKDRDWPTLHDQDQLLREKRMNPSLRLRGYDEGALAFTPTYKYDVFTDQFDSSEKRRTPAWCDRILFRVSPSVPAKGQVEAATPERAPAIKLSNPQAVRQLVYRRWDEVKNSDHRPISSEFQIRVKETDTPRRQRILEREVRQAWENLVIPEWMGISLLEHLTKDIGYDMESSTAMVRWSMENRIPASVVVDRMWSEQMGS